MKDGGSCGNCGCQPPYGCLEELWRCDRQVAHALLRYKSLEMLQFESINQKRACLLAQQHLAGQPLACAWLQHSNFGSAEVSSPGGDFT